MLMNVCAYSNIAIESLSALMKLFVALMKVHNMLLIQLCTQINAHFLLMNSERCSCFSYACTFACDDKFVANSVHTCEAFQSLL